MATVERPLRKDAERNRQVAEYRALIETERSTGGLPETALDALTQPPS